MIGEQKREPRWGMWTVIEGLVLVLLIAASVPPQVDELVSNLDEADEGTAKVLSSQHHAQTKTLLSVAPANIHIREEARHFAISWDKVPHATGYYVQWKWGDQEFRNERQRYVKGVDSTSVRLRLAAGAGQRHTIRVRATNAGADGPWSGDLTATPKMGLLVSRVQ